MNDEPDLKNAYALQTPEDNKTLYAQWAKTYDADFAESHSYILPSAVCAAFVEAGGTGPVLDIGAGTGLCGALLAKAGVGDIDAVDLSLEMLDVARSKHVYRTLMQANLLEGVNCADGRYCGIVSSGTFTHGHVGPSALEEVVRLLAPGGLAVLSINSEHFEALGFDTALNDLRPNLASVSLSRTRIYAEWSTSEHSEDTAVIAQLRKA